MSWGRGKCEGMMRNTFGGIAFSKYDMSYWSISRATFEVWRCARLNSEKRTRLLVCIATKSTKIIPAFYIQDFIRVALCARELNWPLIITIYINPHYTTLGTTLHQTPFFG
jgi:hypothetical protein